jgi:short-subunit dehydrogenase
MVVDVDSDRSVAEGVAATLVRHGHIDAVVASAGWGIAGAVEHTDLAEAHAQFETNFWGAVRVMQAVLPSMRQQARGRIVLISSIGGAIGIPFQAFYSASKFALEGLAEALAYEVGPFGIDVTVVQPGNVRTDFTANRRMAAEPDNSAYSQAMRKAVAIMERDEANGVDADEAAVVVQKILNAKRPPRRVSVGKAGERVGLLAKRLLPYRIFEAAAKSSLGVG